MTSIGFIGSGNIGSTVAKLAVEAGYEVVVSNSRGPETLTGLVASLGDAARAGTSQEAAQADLVVLTIPLGRVSELPADLLAGKTVIDTCNYYPQRDGTIEVLEQDRATTSGLVAEHFPDAQIVKAFNNIYFRTLAVLPRPAGAEDRTTLVIAGDDLAAKQLVTDFIDSIGYDVLDTGSLADSWRYQRDQPAYAGAYAANGNFEQPLHARAAELRDLLAQADPAIH